MTRKYTATLGLRSILLGRINRGIYRRTFLIAALLCSLLNVQGQHKFVFRGELPEGYDNQKVYLGMNDYYSSDNFRRLDSVTIRNGTFSFQGNIARPAEQANLFIRDQNGRNVFYMQLLVDTGEHLLKISRLDSNYHAHNSGFCQKDSSEISLSNSPGTDLIRTLNNLSASFYCLYAVRTPGFEYPSLPANRQDGLDSLMFDMVKRNPDNYYSLIFLRSKISKSILNDEEQLKVFNSFSRKLKETTLGIEVNALLNERIVAEQSTAIGKKVPNFSVETSTGSLFKNTALAGQPYLIVFSATWCIPCQKELPVLVKLYEQYRSRGLKVVYFNLDDDVAKWKAHISKNKLSWINVSEKTEFKDSKISNQFHVYSVPTCFIIDKNGNIVYNADQMDEGLNKLEEYIKSVL